jgi:hypothetical protein
MLTNLKHYVLRNWRPLLIILVMLLASNALTYRCTRPESVATIPAVDSIHVPVSASERRDRQTLDSLNALNP